METKYKTQFLSKEQKKHLRSRGLRPHDYISNKRIEDFLNHKVNRLCFGNWRA